MHAGMGSNAFLSYRRIARADKAKGRKTPNRLEIPGFPEFFRSIKKNLFLKSLKKGETAFF